MRLFNMWEDGLLPLWHKQWPQDSGSLQKRDVIYVVGIDRREVQPGEEGDYQLVDEHRGDLLGGYFWVPDSQASREISAAAFAWPVYTWTRNDRNRLNKRGDDTGGVVSGLPVAISGLDTATTFDTSAFPIADPGVDQKGGKVFLHDFRFARELPNFHELWPIIPGKVVGTILDATQEDKQTPLYIHGDPRLWCLNRRWKWEASSLVCDVDKFGEPDPRRRAPLHSAFRVILPKPGCWPFKTHRAALCLQAGTSGLDGLEGLLMIYDTMGAITPPGRKPVITQLGSGPGQDPDGLDGRRTQAIPLKSDTNNTTTEPQPSGAIGVVGAYGVKASGPIDVGDRGDKHKIGDTEDGEDINSGHFGTGGYWIGDGEKIPRSWDGPTEFKRKLYSNPPLYPVPVQVWKTYDPEMKHAHICGEKKGVFRYEARIPLPPWQKMTPIGNPRKTNSSIRSVKLPRADVESGAIPIWQHDFNKDMGLTWDFQIASKPLPECNILRLVRAFTLSLDLDPLEALTIFWDQQALHFGDFPLSTFGTAELTIPGDTVPLKAGEKYFLSHNVTIDSPIEVFPCGEFWLGTGRLGTTDSYSGTYNEHMPFLLWDIIMETKFFDGPILSRDFNLPLLQGFIPAADIPVATPSFMLDAKMFRTKL